ncbi:inositol monophosphatase family protein [Novosphingobium mathurense]|uniref:Fructose-1,6-bisphosphatase n=1 Tax=Novosphingobium mathurense TaxID=428990 RepID=A0A1U6IVA5_9SPHN|nr:inositol monophosphatase family protein [Novosphingobium mathurense]SLK11913.1 fructose-1,6-bisphosphatase [Novosphingobium mathurense]
MDKQLNNAVAQAMRESARKAILPRFRLGEAIAADWKSAGEAVTVADRESEAILSNKLGRLLPGVNIVGEEAAHDNPEILSHLSRGDCWIIDPLDGTGNFAAGKIPFGVLVALVQDGLPVGGWILDPLTDRFCAAQANCGATINDEIFHVRSPQRSRPQVAVTQLFADIEMRTELFANLQNKFDMLDSPRCAADQYPRIALGENDVTLFTRTIAWDHAAGVLFLNEAGGRAARPDGSPYRCEDAHAGLIAATCSILWEDIAGNLVKAGINLKGAAQDL